MTLNFYVENLIGSKPHVLSPFNFIKYSSQTAASYSFEYTSPSLIKISCSVDSPTYEISNLKFTNNPIICWVDLWCEAKSQLPIDPCIKSLDLSNNSRLELVSLVESRPSLNQFNLQNNPSLTYANLSGCENLAILNLDSCPNIEKINFGKNKSMKIFTLRNCNLTEKAMETLLGNYAPIRNELYSHPKKLVSSYLDLRGNYINWENRKIASKIRMLLCNNILVLWDNNPPDSIIPVSYYKNILNTIS